VLALLLVALPLTAEGLHHHEGRATSDNCPACQILSRHETTTPALGVEWVAPLLVPDAFPISSVTRPRPALLEAFRALAPPRPF
jgi:hypothetical protein